MGTDVTFTLNGQRVKMSVEPSENAINVLNRCGLFGGRESCGVGVCGCCTILVDGDAVSGCLWIGLRLEGRTVETVENLDSNGSVDPIQAAFIAHGAFQCGFCTPGFIMMARQLLAENPRPSRQEICDYLSGNLCRCGAYPEIVSAVESAAAEIAASASG